MKYEFVTHIELYRLVVTESFSPQPMRFNGYTKYLITKEHITSNEIVDVANTFVKYGAKIKYIGKYFTGDYETVGVYGIEHCPDEVALLIKMAL